LRTLPFVCLLAGASAQQRDLKFHIDSHLALVRFQVSPGRGEFVSDLRPGDIRILEDGVPQKIVHFEGGRFYPRSVPLEVTLLFDCSGSVQTAGILNPYVFEDSLLVEYPNAAVAIDAFSGTLTRLAAPGRDPAVLRRALDRVAEQPAGETALFQSTLDALRDTVRGAGAALRMLVVISDGETTIRGDDLTDALAVRTARELGIAIFPVMITAPGALAAMKEHIVSVRKFLDMGPATGGEAITTASTEDLLPHILRALAARVQFEYVAGYYPEGTPGIRHEVQVVWSGPSRGAILGGSRVVVH
jgi:VWFA-related protein